LGGRRQRQWSAYDTSLEVTPHLTPYALPGMLSVVGQLESMIARAVVPGADGAALLKKARGFGL